MNDVLKIEDYLGATPDKITALTFGGINLMSVANITYQDLKIKNDIKIDCESIQKKIPEIKEVYYKKEPDEIKLFIFYDETSFKIRSKIFDEIVRFRRKYNSHFDFKVFTINFDRDVIEIGMEKII